ncbi:MAG: S-layer homology domain-containing protein, partial [Oscillospiraceae bacterium]
MKKLISIFLIASVFCLSMGNFISFAEGVGGTEKPPISAIEKPKFELNLPVTDIIKGDEVYIDVNLSNIKDVYAFEMTLEYNKDFLKFDKVSSKFDKGDNVSLKDDSKIGIITYVFSNIGNENVIKGQLANFVFIAKKEGKTNVTLKNATIVNSDMTYIECVNMQEYIDVSIKKKPSSSGGGGSSGGSGGGGGRPSGGGSISTGGNTTTTTNPVQTATPIPMPTTTPIPTITPTPTPTVSPIIENFTDIEGVDWAKESIDYLIENNYINGYNDGTFRPNNGITRAEFAKLISNIFELNYTNEPLNFTDANKNDWYAPYVASCVKSGIFSGDNNGKFRPNEFIS